MEKVAIITLNGYFNYGNRLQNYALQEVVKSMGFYVETLVAPRIIKGKSLGDKLALVLRQSPRKSYYSFVEKFKALNMGDGDLELMRARNKEFINFTRTYIRESNVLVNDLDYLSEIAADYNFFIVGSDQVWNPYYVENSPLYLLEFVEQSKKVAYAASFGVNAIPKQFVNSYKDAIRDFRYISVREDKAASIIKDICDIDVPVLVDPTLLISKSEWQSISKQSRNKPQEGYLLTYFLGSIPIRTKKDIMMIAGKYDLQTINLGQMSERDVYCTGPSEFIDYVKDCTIFCTDSFHGVAFAIIFNKPFIVFRRKGPLDMYSRIETLLAKFGLESRSSDQIDYSTDILDISYSRPNEILHEEKEKALNFLQSALKPNQKSNS